MSYITNEQEIKEAADVLSTIMETAPGIELKKQGANWIGKCPLPGHNEKTGSFTVSPTKRMWKCFGCGKGGDAARFVMEMNREVYPAALERVAKASKITVQYDKSITPEQRAAYNDKKRQLQERRESLRAFLKGVVEQMQTGNAALPTVEVNGIVYVDFAGRRYKQTTLERFSLCAPFDGNFITDFADKNKWSIPKLVQLGILNMADNGKAYDVWKSRWIFPIRDADGHFVTLGGRATKEKLAEGWSKYMNGKGYDPTNYNLETDNILYNKSKTFYGFHEGKKIIYAKEAVMLVEGYTDVCSLHEAGFETAVATCGTALTLGHIEVLKSNGISDVTIFRDGDKAGILAAERDVKLLVENGIAPYVVLCDVFSKGHFERWFSENVPFGSKLSLYEVEGMFEEVTDTWAVETDATQAPVWEKIAEGSTLKKYVLKCWPQGQADPITYEPAAHDPDSLVRELSKNDFKAFLEVKKQDGLIWLVMKDYRRNDVQVQAATIQQAASLLQHIKDPARGAYLKNLTQGENLGSVQRAIESEIKKLEAAKGDKKQRFSKDLDEQQMSDAADYGIFIRNNQYWRYDKENYIYHGQAVTNFIFEPRYLIKDPVAPARIMTIKNVYGHTAVMNMAPDIFGSIGKMQDVLSGEGNFIFEPGIKATDFSMIRKMVFDQMKDHVAYRLMAMGHHHNGFYVWSNGLFAYEDGWLPCDELGLVEKDGVKYLLPGRAHSDDPNYEKTEASDEYIKKFSYYQGEGISFDEWGVKFIEVYGENGAISMMWAFASLFRDVIWAKHKGFPHINFSGKKGSGKSRIMWSIMALWGEAHQDGALGNSTYKSFFQTFMQKVNAVVWFEEFHSKLDFGTWIKSMMAVYDNTGRNKADIASHISTKKTTIKSAFAYTGQDEPTGLGDDNALWSRTIVREPKKNTAPNAYKLLDELTTIEDSGQLTAITCAVLKHRKKVEKQYPRIMNEQMEALKAELNSRGGLAQKAEDRTLNNLVPLLAMYRILEAEISFPFAYDELVGIVIDQIKYQTKGILTQDKEAVWWDEIQLLTNGGKLRHDKHLIVQEVSSVNIAGGQTKTLKPDTPVLFLRMLEAYSEYRLDMVKKQNNDLTPEGILFKDLQKSEAYIGVVPSKKFEGNSRVYRCWAFDLSKLMETEFITTAEALELYRRRDGNGAAEEKQPEAAF